MKNIITLIFSVFCIDAFAQEFKLPVQMGVMFSGDSEQTASANLDMTFPIAQKIMVGFGVENTNQDLEGETQKIQGGSVFVQNHPLDVILYDLRLGAWNVDGEVITNYVNLRLGWMGDSWSIAALYRRQDIEFDTVNASSVLVETIGEHRGLEIQYMANDWAVSIMAERGEYTRDLTNFDNDLAYLLVPESALSVFPSFASQSSQLRYDYYFKKYSLGFSVGRSESAVTEETFNSIELRTSYTMNKKWSFLGSIGSTRSPDSDDEESAYRFMSLGFDYKF